MKKVIVVDDDDLVRPTVCYMLRILDFDVTEAASGTEALRLLSESKFDLVITDLFMPKFNGLELILEIKQMASDTPVVLMTGGAKHFPPDSKGLNDLTDSAELFGASYVIQKPFKKDNLKSIVKQAIAQK